MTQQQTQDGSGHAILWNNVQALREALRTFAASATARGAGDEAQARLFVERKVADIARGDNLDALWDDLELLYRRLTAVAVEAIGQGQHEAGQAFVGSAGMLLGLIQPQLSDDERHEQLMASLEKRASGQWAG